MTESTLAGHSAVVSLASAALEDSPGLVGAPDFAGVYRQEFDFVWRSLHRLGVAPPALDDAVQEVFMIVHRRLDSFEGRSTLRSWLFGIALRVASDYRRSLRRKPEHDLPPELPDPGTLPPDERAARAQEVRLVYAALDELDADKRAVFVLAELEQMTAPEIAQALSIKLNTVYSRLRAARRDFERALAIVRARSERKTP